jgi:cytochrome P450
LLEHPLEWVAVKADQSLIPGAVAEGMRYDPSVGSIARFTSEPLEIGYVWLSAGVMLSVSTMSAMRDPALYADPGRFDIRRADHPRLHPVFGLGPHRCIGEMLARLEMEEGLAALISATPDIEMEAPPRLLGFGGIRQITPMPVRIR